MIFEIIRTSDYLWYYSVLWNIEKKSVIADPFLAIVSAVVVIFTRITLTKIFFFNWWSFNVEHDFSFSKKRVE